MTERAVCVVPGCRNSSARYARSRYLCSRHWREVPRWMKRRRQRIARRLVELGELLPPAAKDPFYRRGPVRVVRCGERRAFLILHMAWLSMERAAIRRASGL